MDVSPSTTRLPRVLIWVGVAGLIASLAVGVGGWIMAGSLTTTLNQTLIPASRTVEDVSVAIDATRLMVSRTTEAIENIENATRSSARTLNSVTELLGGVGEVAAGDIADGLDAAVEALPGLIETGRLIDRSLRALSLLGVDYAPAVPLDEALSDLEAALAPVPDKIRDQATLLEDVTSDMETISDDAGALAASLLEVRIGMLEADRVLIAAASNAQEAAAAAGNLQADVDAYGQLARWVAVAAALALASGALGPLLIGISKSSETALKEGSVG